MTKEGTVIEGSFQGVELIHGKITFPDGRVQEVLPTSVQQLANHGGRFSFIARITSLKDNNIALLLRSL
jgi:hypothetical protein